MSDGRPLDLGTVNVGGHLPTEAIVPDVPSRGWAGRAPMGSLDGTALVVRRGQTDILRGVDAHAVPGRPLALTGPSGSGKSTLLAVLGGLLTPDSGSVTFESRPVVPGDAALRRDIGVVLQGYGLVGLLTARENVEVSLRVLGLPPDRVAVEADRALDQVGLGDRGHHLVEDLSGGQQQRVALARVLAAQPPAVLADEPTAELDHETRDAVLGLLLEYATGEPGRVLVIATHDPDVAALCTDHVRLVDGRAVLSP
ncbi:MAG TPA: ABC transporter ATP-binding protein [Mycobacteriales bacterium]